MSPNTQIAVLCGVAAALVALAVWIGWRVRGTPQKRERKRRLNVHKHGRLGEAVVTEASEGVLYYSYDLRGVHYTASQDVSSLTHLLPAEPNRLVGHSGMKYSPNNPANSILLCEEWNGLRVQVGDASVIAGVRPAMGRSHTGTGP
jgi:hypothetical protein